MTSTTEKTDTQKLSKTKDQQISHGHKLRSPLAPAIHHNLALSLISCMMELKLDRDPPKTQQFLCFQIHHATTTNELKPL